jgi:hypothetical protein
MIFFTSRQFLGVSFCSLFLYTLSLGMNNNIENKYLEKWRQIPYILTIEYDGIQFMKHATISFFGTIIDILTERISHLEDMRNPYPNHYDFIEYLAAKEARGWHQQETFVADPIDYYDAKEGIELEIKMHRFNLAAMKRLTNQQIDTLLDRASLRSLQGEGLMRPLTWFYDEVKARGEENEVPYFMNQFKTRFYKRAEMTCTII